jgi:hypothetical protein
VGSSAFTSDTKLTNVNLPKVTTLDSNAFDNCQTLKNINLPSVTTISSYSFKDCYAIKSMRISNVTNISNYAFNNCSNLLAVIIEQTNSVCTLANTLAFRYCYHIQGIQNSYYNPNGDKDGYIYVPDSLVDSYKSATNWSTYADQIKPLSELPQEYKDLYGIS